MTEDKTGNDIFNCIILHIENTYEKMIYKYYISEENMHTIMGKYWNLFWVNYIFKQEQIDEVKLNYLIHCYLKH